MTRPTATLRLPAFVDRDEADGGTPDAGGRGVFDHARIERAVRELLLGLGEDPTRDGLLDTPSRVARAYAEMCGGLTEDAGVHLARQFDQECDGPVVLRDIQFTSICEHHLLPFVGKAHVAYLPGN
ncbi:MAG: GTP cyclohydrolase I, partial [Phycisphaerales bacterium]|nr:GTP cyclohydrolase I [Phycisphaerales bacterium]